MNFEFKPIFQITPHIADCLMRIAAAKNQVLSLPLNPMVLSNLRESAKLFTTHYSTQIEGNRLEPQEIKQIIHLKGHFPGLERDEKEVKSYYTALEVVEKYAALNQPVTEKVIQTLHALVMSEGRTKVKPTPYRSDQNIIRDSSTGAIVYMPPESTDVAPMMKGLVEWINTTNHLCPIIAAIAHYQFATIHPYYDGNGRTARLLTTLILHLGGFDLKGLYSLEEYYAKNLLAYYRAISVGPSHNYYFGRAEADLTTWVDYFISGMAHSFEKVALQMSESQNKGSHDQTSFIKSLDPKQRKTLELFMNYNVVTSQQIGELFGFKSRTSAALCKKWVDTGFLEIIDHSKKARKYKLTKACERIMENVRVK